MSLEKYNTKTQRLEDTKIEVNSLVRRFRLTEHWRAPMKVKED